MATTNEKIDIILKYEEAFANALAGQVIGKPKLSVWMILIPIIFVYYVYQYQRYTEGRKTFAANYLNSRKRALNEAVLATETGKCPNIEGMINQSGTPQAAQKPYSEWIAALVEYYADLLCSEGEDFASLVRSAYKNRTNFLLILNRLNQVERALNAALKPYLSDASEVIDKVVRNIERCSERLRRDNAESIFT